MFKAIANHFRAFRDMLTNTNDVAQKLLGQSYDSLDERTKQVARHVAEGKFIARNAAKEFDANSTLPQRAADVVANFGGSWTFLALFAAVCMVWVGLNSYVLLQYDRSFDPYPYIFLNLLLSLLAAIQAPIILMSQNRQAERDRLHGEHDYEVNLKTELEIMLLHEKMDLLRAELKASRLEPIACKSTDAAK